MGFTEFRAWTLQTPPASEEAGYNDGARFDGGHLQRFAIPSAERTLSLVCQREPNLGEIPASLGIVKCLRIAMTLT